MRPHLYLAAPLFSVAERDFNVCVCDCLSDLVDVYLPQKDGGLFVDLVAEGMPVEAACRKIFDGDVRAIDRCDYLLIIMDGRSIDEGAAFELGYAAAKGKTCIGMQTDIRRLLPIGNNPMIVSPLAQIFDNAAAVYKWLEEDIENRSNDLRLVGTAAE